MLTNLLVKKSVYDFKDTLNIFNDFKNKQKSA